MESTFLVEKFDCGGGAIELLVMQYGAYCVHISTFITLAVHANLQIWSPKSRFFNFFWQSFFSVRLFRDVAYAVHSPYVYIFSYCNRLACCKRYFHSTFNTLAVQANLQILTPKSRFFKCL